MLSRNAPLGDMEPETVEVERLPAAVRGERTGRRMKIAVNRWRAPIVQPIALLEICSSSGV